jgi:hypothetical protein
MTARKKIQRDWKRQTAGIATGHVNVRPRAHQYCTRRIDIAFQYGEKSLRMPGTCRYGGKCGEKARNIFHATTNITTNALAGTWFQ